MSFKEKLKTLLQTKFVKKTCMVFSLIAMTSALALVAIACTPEQNVQDPSSSPITTPSDDLKPGDGIITPGDETTDPTDPDITDPENPDITDPETPTEPEDPGITEPEDPDITEPTDPENPDFTDPETPVDPEEPEIWTGDGNYYWFVDTTAEDGTVTRTYYVAKFCDDCGEMYMVSVTPKTGDDIPESDLPSYDWAVKADEEAAAEEDTTGSEVDAA